MRIFTKQDLRGPGFLDETQFVPLRDVHDQAAALAALNARVAELEAKLETAWDDALEEAAIEVAAMAETDAYMNKVWRNGCRDAADAIRAMKGETP